MTRDEAASTRLRELFELCSAYERFLVSEDPRATTLMESQARRTASYLESGDPRWLKALASEYLRGLHETDARVRARFLTGLSPSLAALARELDAKFRRRVTKVLTAGQIKNEADQRAIREFVAGREQEESEEVSLAMRMLEEFERRP
jgi:hypothetical protein